MSTSSTVTSDAPTPEVEAPRAEEEEAAQLAQQEFTAEGEEHWAWLLPLVRRAGCPVADRRFSQAAALTQLPAADDATIAQDTVLHKLRLCSEAGLLEVLFDPPSTLHPFKSYAA